MAAAAEIPVFEVGPDMQKDEPELHVRLASERVTAEELICARVAREVERYNAHESESFCDFERGSVERRLNRPRDEVDAEAQQRHALRAFTANRFLLFVDDQQVDALDEELVLTPASEICFVRLVPLAGG